MKKTECKIFVPSKTGYRIALDNLLNGGEITTDQHARCLSRLNGA